MHRDGSGDSGIPDVSARAPRAKPGLGPRAALLPGAEQSSVRPRAAPRDLKTNVALFVRFPNAPRQACDVIFELAQLLECRIVAAGAAPPAQNKNTGDAFSCSSMRRSASVDFPLSLRGPHHSITAQACSAALRWRSASCWTFIAQATKPSATAPDNKACLGGCYIATSPRLFDVIVLSGDHPTTPCR